MFHPHAKDGGVEPQARAQHRLRSDSAARTKKKSTYGMILRRIAFHTVVINGRKRTIFFNLLGRFAKMDEKDSDTEIMGKHDGY